jgi:hypothetical protein
MLIENIKEEWQKDSSMSSDYHRESMKTPQLHSKYLNYYFDEKKALTRMSKALAKMRRIRFEYYTGTINPVMLDKFKWEPFLRKILKSEVDMYLDADDVLSTMQIDHTDQKEKIKFIEEVLKQLGQRNFQIKEAITWQKFVAGN